MRSVVKLTCIFFVFLLLSPLAFTQTIDTLWTNNHWYGYFDSATCVQETSDSGFIITGMSQIESANGLSVIRLLKTDSLGEIEWTKTYGDTVGEVGYHVLQSHDGGYLISASTFRIGNGGGAIWIIKTNAVGDTLWTYYLNPDDRSGFPMHAVQTLDSGFAITGRINISTYYNDAFILRLDKDGSLVNYNNFGGDELAQDGCFITQLPDSGFIVTGLDNNLYSTNHDFYAFRTNKNLTMLWDSSYAITEYDDIPYGACKVDDGIVMVGIAMSEGYAHKIDFDGHTVWSKSISQYFTAEQYTSVCPASDLGIMVGGWYRVGGKNREYAFIKLHQNGDVMSTFTVGGSENDHGQYITPTYDGNFVQAGFSRSFTNGYGSIYMTKVTESFNTLVGDNVEVALDNGVDITFQTVKNDGETNLTIDNDGSLLPGAYLTVPMDPTTVYNILTTADYDGVVEICFTYNPDDVLSDEEDLFILHYNGVDWENITSSLDTENNIICGITDSFSPFIIAQPNPNCCINPTGDIDNNGNDIPDINDLLFLVDFMFLPPGAAPEPPCMDEANIDGLGDATPNIADLLYLVDYMFLPPGSAPAPADCL